MKKPVIRTAIDALLAIQQGFDLIENSGCEFSYDSVLHWLDRLYDSHCYLTPETAHLLEPQNSDLGIDCHGEPYLYCAETGEWVNAACQTEKRCRIIQRNNQPFPKWEYEE